MLTSMLMDMHWTGKVQSIAFTIFGKDVAWYGIIITTAMLVGMFAAIKRGKRIGITADDVLELFICAIPLAIICARLGYVMVRPEEYFMVENFGWSDFVNVIAIWDGGLTILTGVPGGVLGGFLWAKWRKVKFIDLADALIPVVLLSQAIGRWGNFCNQEIYGALVTNPSLQWFPYSVYIANKGAFYQATFFYEMMLSLMFFIAIIVVLRRLSVRGGGMLLYTGSYAFIRFLMEFIRDDGDLYAKVNYTQIGCGLVFAACAIFLAVLIVKKVKKGEQVWYAKGIPVDKYPVAKLPKTPALATAVGAQGEGSSGTDENSAKDGSPNALFSTKKPPNKTNKSKKKKHNN